jgi:hypothetical protein
VSPARLSSPTPGSALGSLLSVAPSSAQVEITCAAGSALDSWYLHGPGTDDVLARWESGTLMRWALAGQEGSVRDLVTYAACHGAR